MSDVVSGKLTANDGSGMDLLCVASIFLGIHVTAILFLKIYLLFSFKITIQLGMEADSMYLLGPMNINNALSMGNIVYPKYHSLGSE